VRFCRPARERIGGFARLNVFVTIWLTCRPRDQIRLAGLIELADQLLHFGVYADGRVARLNRKGGCRACPGNTGGLPSGRVGHRCRNREEAEVVITTALDSKFGPSGFQEADFRFSRQGRSLINSPLQQRRGDRFRGGRAGSTARGVAEEGVKATGLRVWRDRATQTWLGAPMTRACQVCAAPSLLGRRRRVPRLAGNDEGANGSVSDLASSRSSRRISCIGSRPFW
jgi:hypothetical protein